MLTKCRPVEKSVNDASTAMNTNPFEVDYAHAPKPVFEFTSELQN